MLDFRIKFKPQEWKKFYYKENSEILIDENNASDEYFGYLGESKTFKRFFVASSNTKKDIEVKLPAPKMNMDWQIYSRTSKGEDKYILKPYELVVYIEN